MQARLERAIERHEERMDAMRVPATGQLSDVEQLRRQLVGTGVEDAEDFMAFVKTNVRGALTMMVAAQGVPPVLVMEGLWVQAFLTGLYFEREGDDD